MGREIESRIADATAGGYQHFIQYVERQGQLELFVWLGLLYLKTHLKDRHYRRSLDVPGEDRNLAEDYGWEHLHHVHSVVRCFQNGAVIDSKVLGSMFIFPIRDDSNTDLFDYGDLYFAQTVFVRINDIGIVVILNDSAYAISFLMDMMQKIKGPLLAIQARELLVNFAYENLCLHPRPLFRSDLDLEAELYNIVVERPAVKSKELDLRIRGGLMANAFRDILPNLRFDGKTVDDSNALILQGNITFLFDTEGKFVKNLFLAREE